MFGNAPKEKPGFWKSTIIFLRPWLISLDFPMMPSKKTLGLKGGPKVQQVNVLSVHKKIEIHSTVNLLDGMADSISKV